MDDEINLREYLEVMRKRWKIIIGIVFVLSFSSFLISSFQPKIYEAKLTLLFKSSTSNNLSGFAAMASLGGLGVPSSSGGLGDLNDLLQSRAVAARVLLALSLRDHIKGWNDEKISDIDLASAVQSMLKKPKVSGNIIELKVENNDPGLAAEIANGYASALTYYWNSLNLTEAQKKREYIESQLPRVEKELKKAEEKLKQFTLIVPIDVEKNSSSIISVELNRLTRELEIQGSVYTMLRKEYETVKLEESKQIIPFSIIDKAELPKSPVKPKKKQNLMIGLVLGLFFGVFISFFLEYWDNSNK